MHMGCSPARRDTNRRFCVHGSLTVVRSTMTERQNAIGYLRVSTSDQSTSGAGLAAQRSAIEREAAHRDWDVQFVEETGSGRSLTGRPGLLTALDDLEHGNANVLVVAKLDRLSRSLLDFANLMQRAQRHNWNLIALDLGIDLSTPAGEFMASVMASAAQWERRIIGQRTREALAAKRAAGVRLGRPPEIPQSVREFIVSERASGLGYTAIARVLDTQAIPTARGGATWRPSTIRRIVRQTVAAD